MGLDICLRKPVVYTEDLRKKVDDYKEELDKTVVSGIEGIPELLPFKKFFFKELITYYNWEATFKEKNLDIKDFNWYSSGGTTEEFDLHEKECQEQDIEINWDIFDSYHTYQHKNSKELVKFKNSEVITFTVEEDCLLSKQVGYQRKGANTEFYKEGSYKNDLSMWDYPPILDLKTLEEHHKKYFSIDEECANNFKENIIDKFIEGETFVVYC